VFCAWSNPEKPAKTHNKEICQISKSFSSIYYDLFKGAEIDKGREFNQM